MKDYIQKIIRAFTTSEYDRKVTKEVHRWLLDEEHTNEKEEALRNLWEETEGKVDAGIWNSLSKVYDKVGLRNRDMAKMLHMRMWQYTAAAIVVLVVSVSTTFFFTKNVYSTVAMIEKITPAGDMKTVELPDGSMVQTNSGTILFYPEVFKGDTRTIYLIGEANFKVKKNPNQPFIVKSGAMSVTALGTEFNIMAYPEKDEIVATLIHGKIKVECNDDEKSYILNPGQQVTYLNASSASTLAYADLEDVTAWQKGIFVFRGATMKDVLTALERKNAVTFQYNINLFNDDKYNFQFREHADLDEIMGIIQEVAGGFTYKIEKNVCYIKAIRKK